MVSVVTQSSPHQSILFDSICATTQKTLDVVYRNLWIPISTGILVGMGNFFVVSFLAEGLEWIPGLVDAFADAAIAQEYTETIMGSFWNTVVEGPFLEEVVFRVLIQDVLHKITQKIFPDVDVEIFSSTVKLAALVAIVASAIIFGWAHYSSGFGLLHVILATMSGITLGLLKHHHGLVASTAAHMTNNAIVFGLSSLAD